ncbi:hypothetical protein [Sunxiuqinia elliptica]|uniref:Uncharacterized protein n=1 Tax=Sunxiuqinia elliptica TaxID=655355 RepID=A0A1I2MG58_9BACT|nr:hypothetical protein [Sunxiuqinia elliptica]SFF90453.1 hypothetical protein SAMN05216283_1213 [Sunxiuqinia elliptica]
METTIDTNVLNYLQNIVNENISRRTYSNNNASYFTNKLLEDVTYPTTNLHISNALKILSAWLYENSKLIDGICFYGSFPSHAMVSNSITVPKINKEYQDNVFVIGPSDLDFFVFSKHKNIKRPVYQTDYIEYNLSSLNSKVISKDLFESISIFDSSDYINDIELDNFVLPMFLRFLIDDGYWFKDELGIQTKLKNKYKRETYFDSSIKFYERRVNNLINIYNKIVQKKLEIKSIYGTNYSLEANKNGK